MRCFRVYPNETMGPSEKFRAVTTETLRRRGRLTALAQAILNSEVGLQLRLV